MRNPYRPYQHTDGKWYVSHSRSKTFYRDVVCDTKAQAQLRAVKRWAFDLQAAQDRCHTYIAKHDPDYRDSDPYGYLA